MLVFAVLFLVANAISLYFYLWDPFMSQWYRDPLKVQTPAMRGMMLLDLIEFIAVGFLVWVTVD
jgi:hypothetical protein